MGGFGLFPDGDEELRAVPLLRVCEGLDLVKRGLIQMDVLPERGHVTGLFADDLRRRILDDARTMLIRTIRCPDEVFRCLADTPHTRIALARGAEELHNHARQNR